MTKTFPIGGVHPSDSKISRDKAIVALPIPPTVWISMCQHIGAPAVPVVEVGQKVRTGQVIAEPGGFVSAYIHSSVTGTVKSIGPRADISGKMVPHIEIETMADEWVEEVDLSNKISFHMPENPSEIIEAVKAAGIVGLGGATFPTHVKLTPPPGKVAEFLILNGTECEPYLTSDYRIMMERAEEIVIGAGLLRKALGEQCRCVIGIEENKPEAIKSIRNAIDRLKILAGEQFSMQVVTLKKKYPQGGEKQLIRTITGREVKSMALPIDAGAVVQNVGTALAVYEAVQKHKPLITNVLTVTGDCLDDAFQRNWLFRTGTPISFVLNQIGGVPADAAKVISGGPMMGKAIANLDATLVKGSSAILFLTEAQTRRVPETSCIRCGKCAEACPMGLEPFLLYREAKAGMMEELEKHSVYDCIECGCCLYTCPAGLPLLDTIRLAKGDVLGAIRSRSKK